MFSDEKCKGLRVPVFKEVTKYRVCVNVHMSSLNDDKNNTKYFYDPFLK